MLWSIARKTKRIQIYYLHVENKKMQYHIQVNGRIQINIQWCYLRSAINWRKTDIFQVWLCRWPFPSLHYIIQRDGLKLIPTKTLLDLVDHVIDIANQKLTVNNAKLFPPVFFFLSREKEFPVGYMDFIWLLIGYLDFIKVNGNPSCHIIYCKQHFKPKYLRFYR